MNAKSRLRMMSALVGLVLARSPLLAQNAPQRAIAITIDDLPAGGATSMTATEITEMTAKLLSTLKEQKVPTVGFVNERKLYKEGEVDARIKALNMWLESGFELGNHTFSHTSLNNAPLQAWEDDVVRGETVTKTLLFQHKMKLRYFRHPFLDTGRDLQTRREAEGFLIGRGYRIAPVTMDGWDWNFAGVYEEARKRGDTALEQKLVSAYLAYTTSVFDYYEKFSKDLIGYEPKQVLLLHANWLEAEHIDELLDLLRKRGYEFVTLQDALGDDAYGMPDEYVGEEGRGWIEHWAITRGRPPLNAPEFPEWVKDRYKALPPQPREEAIF
ncbi:MAG TPA: polysaccharide deacetylase family protein [Candidatus Acidoferrum sp.]|nr:polysaccharide deacetylase family protein [Candidatus Acidoferrum sp.]